MEKKEKLNSLLDEFTNALDKNSALDLYHFLSIYNKMHEVVIINITHNLSDLEYMEGKYYYIHNHKIDQIESKKEIIGKRQIFLRIS